MDVIFSGDNSYGSFLKKKPSSFVIVLQESERSNNTVMFACCSACTKSFILLQTMHEIKKKKKCKRTLSVVWHLDSDLVLLQADVSSAQWDVKDNVKRCEVRHGG